MFGVGKHSGRVKPRSPKATYSCGIRGNQGEIKSQRDCFAARLKKAYKQAMSKWEDEYECPACRFHLGLLLRPQRPPERSAGSTGWNGNLGVVLFTSFHHPNVMIYDDFLPTFHKIHSKFHVSSFDASPLLCSSVYCRLHRALPLVAPSQYLASLQATVRWTSHTSHGFQDVARYFTTFYNFHGSFTCQILMIFRE